jgi:hypothetical protein
MPRMEALESEVTRRPSLEKRFDRNENVGPVRQFLLDGYNMTPGGWPEMGWEAGHWRWLDDRRFIC